jgi:hypothetical protein
VRRRESGRIEFLGRADDQVKALRGYRLELGDVEHELRQHAGIADCVVVARSTPTDDGQPGETKLVAYVVWRTGGYETAHAERPTVEKVTEWLRERVPDHMVPATIIVLDALPLSANGKVDKHALPEPSSEAAGEAYVAPRTDTETALAAIWQDVLKKDRVGVTDDFLALGGHSLLAIPRAWKDQQAVRGAVATADAVRFTDGGKARSGSRCGAQRIRGTGRGHHRARA